MAIFLSKDQIPTPSDLASVRRVVKRRAARRMNEQDIEDLAADFIISAVVTASQPDRSAPIAVIARAYASRSGDRYKRASDVACAAHTSLALEPGAGSYSRAALNVASERDEYVGVEVRSVLATMPVELVRILTICDLEGGTLKEAAITLGVSIATAHRRLGDARAAFRTAWGER